HAPPRSPFFPYTTLFRSASVVGMDLGHDAVCALLPDDAQPFVERHLDALQRKRLIERVGANRFRFCHSLIRLAAYQSMTREDRADRKSTRLNSSHEWISY